MKNMLKGKNKLILALPIILILLFGTVLYLDKDNTAKASSAPSPVVMEPPVEETKAVREKIAAYEMEAKRQREEEEAEKESHIEEGDVFFSADEKREGDRIREERIARLRTDPYQRAANEYNRNKEYSTHAFASRISEQLNGLEEQEDERVERIRQESEEYYEKRMKGDHASRKKMEKYIPKDNEALFIRNIATTLMKNLESSWKEKTDFWANNAINYVFSIAYKCYKDRQLGIGTLAHVIAFALSDSNLVFAWLAEDPEIALNMSSMLTAWRLGAQQQTAGAVSSAQTPLVLLNNKYIFWVLSPTPEEEFSLDITNPEHPTLLCIGNSPSNKEAVSPPISCIASILMAQMNNPGKVKSVFMVDEFPTIMLQGIDTFIGTARKHYVSTILAVQDFNQAIRDYGEKSANILKSSCGTQAYGMTGNDKTARDIESLFGERKERQESISHNEESGTGSTTESLQREKVIRARDIAGQSIGHFTGKIAGGKPPFFSAQFKQSTYVEQEIPEFSKPVQIEGKPELENEILEEIVTQNYYKVINTVTGVLEKYGRTGKDSSSPDPNAAS